jgi:hypothetical protein
LAFHKPPKLQSQPDETSVAGHGEEEMSKQTMQRPQKGMLGALRWTAGK